MADIELLEGEEWRPVVGYEGLYEVSNMGRVRSLDRIEVTKAGWSRPVKGVVKKAFPINASRNPKYGAYQSYHIREKRKLAHVLVMESFFCGPPPYKAEIMHLNGLRYDNRLENLKYGTRAENHRQSYAYGGKSGPGKLTLKDVSEIRRRTAQGEGVLKLAREYGIDKTGIARIRDGKRFAWFKDGDDLAT